MASNNLLEISESIVHELSQRAKVLCAPGKGILAADESVRTIGKRLEAHGLSNDVFSRRRLRDMLLTTSKPLETWLSGVILFEETLTQSPCFDDTKTFASFLSERGILPGIKVDTGLVPTPDSPRETTTLGLSGLSERCAWAYEKGARFAKWRAAIRIDVEQNLPTISVVQENAQQLAMYARIAQENGLVPIVEPEILVDGSHQIDDAARVARTVIASVYEALRGHKVCLEGTLLKPMMITPGIQCETRDAENDVKRIAETTLDVLNDVVPPQVPGIMFLSGGMSEREATVCLNEINVVAQKRRKENANTCPWSLSFSFGRALQTSPLLTWRGKDENKEKAGHVMAEMARVNGMAQLGKYNGEHPSVSESDSLYENFRGWRGGNDDNLNEQ